MANISPFKGWRYNSDQIEELSSIYVPPYDVITPAEQELFYNKSPYNNVRINLNRKNGEDQYADAARHLQEWKSKDILIQDKEESIYIISQSFKYKDQEIQRIGCICALKLTELGKIVLPHEQTIEKHIEDRYKLMGTTMANTGQIFMCYKDESLGLEKIYNSLEENPVIDVVMDDVHYRVWQISDIGIINRFRNIMTGKNVVIKDGHHRYKTALRFSQNHPEIMETEKVMVTLVNSKDPGMIVLPTNRLLSGIDFDIHSIVSSLEKDFIIEKMKGLENVVSAMENGIIKKGSFGIYHKESNIGLLLNFNNWENLNIMFSGMSKVSRKLDTNILHAYVLKKVFNIDTSNQRDLKHVSYSRGNESTLELLKKEKDYEVVCCVKPPTLEEIFAISEAGEIMPQKSTYFFPKVYSGLVTRCFNE
ncbi:MAG TPA: DUF1015 domain-containing protein [Candidatus Marinimicrobia bacterium]|jgi:uncharacterized protein (DUF1015 family)|nr:DUF1015 domain-containing protein [Candidatus Neomarinimicrobiota bacterium]